MTIGRPQTIFPQDALEKIQLTFKKVKTALEMRKLQCIILRSKFSYSAKHIGEIVGYSESHVKHVWNQFKKKGEDWIIGEKRGGRFNENMSKEEENEFIESIDDKAKKGGILIVSEIKEKYEKQIGKKTGKTVIYDLLHRHGWRKIAPRPSHPKANLEEQQKFKDGFSPRGKKGIHGSRSSMIKV